MNKERAASDSSTDQRNGPRVEELSARIRTLQLALVRAGFPVRIDGILGPETRAAIRQFQQVSGLPLSGRVDRATAVALRSKLPRRGTRPPVWR